MKFLTEDGKIAEGIPLTDEQARQRENLIAYFHEGACGSSYHSPYTKADLKCETLANAFVTGEILAAANKQPEPEPVEEAPEQQLPPPPVIASVVEPGGVLIWKLGHHLEPAKDEYPF